jgi:signal transduction histidine kinase
MSVYCEPTSESAARRDDPMRETIRAIAAARCTAAVESAAVRGAGQIFGATSAVLAGIDPHMGGRVAVRSIDGKALDALPTSLLTTIAVAAPGAAATVVQSHSATWLVAGMQLRARRAALAVSFLPEASVDQSQVRELELLADVAASASRSIEERNELAERLSRSEALVSAGMKVAEAFDLDTTLHHIVDIAREVIGSRYAALGVLNDDRDGLSNFVWSGISKEDAAAIGGLPRGRGLLGSLITDPRPMRVDRIAGHPQSSGFPPNHPPMTSMLGVPITIRGEVFGNLYFTDKPAGGFTDGDERAAVGLAAQAGIAIGNARATLDRELRHNAERERLLAEAARERQRSEIAALRTTVAAQDAERARISRELHDESGQVLAALTIRCTALDEFIQDPVGRQRFADLRGEIAQTARRVHNVARDLRPDAIRDGLRTALERQAERLETEHGLRVELAIEDLPADLGEDLETTIFRVVQEAVTNVAKHSGARSASVLVLGQQGRLRIVVEDDGRGFDPSAEAEGLGLAGIRDRVSLTGGDMRIESRRGDGTTLVVNLDVKDGGQR